MDKFKWLTLDVAVAEQLTAADIGAVAAAGFRSVINNRPDGEAPDQPASARLAAAATGRGLEYGYQPVVSGQITAADAAAFGRLLSELPRPVLAFCRTGTRSSILWALSEAARRPPEEILRSAAAAGYDLGGIRPQLEMVWQAAGQGSQVDEH